MVFTADSLLNSKFLLLRVASSPMSDNIPRFYYPHVNSTADGSLGRFNYDQGESRPQAA